MSIKITTGCWLSTGILEYPLDLLRYMHQIEIPSEIKSICYKHINEYIQRGQVRKSEGFIMPNACHIVLSSGTHAKLFSNGTIHLAGPTHQKQAQDEIYYLQETVLKILKQVYIVTGQVIEGIFIDEHQRIYNPTTCEYLGYHSDGRYNIRNKWYTQQQVSVFDNRVMLVEETKISEPKTILDGFFEECGLVWFEWNNNKRPKSVKNITIQDDSVYKEGSDGSISKSIGNIQYTIYSQPSFPSSSLQHIIVAPSSKFVFSKDVACISLAARGVLPAWQTKTELIQFCSRHELAYKVYERYNGIQVALFFSSEFPQCKCDGHRHIIQTSECHRISCMLFSSGAYTLTGLRSEADAVKIKFYLEALCAYEEVLPGARQVPEVGDVRLTRGTQQL